MIEINIGPNVFSVEFIQSWAISWHGFFSFVAVATGVILVGRWARLKGIDSDDIYSIAIWAIIGGVLGARLVHVIDNWGDIYSQSPSQVLALWSGGIGLWGGILGGFVAGTAYAVIAKHPVGVIADLAAPAILFGQAIGRVGDIINGEHCANATELFFGFRWIHPETAGLSCANGYSTAVQPVIAYEMIWTTIALVIVWNLRGRLKPDGMLFALYLALYAVGRFGISFMREDPVWALGMQEAHFIAILVLVVTVPLLAAKARFTSRTEESLQVKDRRPRAERRRRARR